MKNERHEDNTHAQMMRAIDGLMQDPPQAEEFLKLADMRTEEAMKAIINKIERESSTTSS